MKVFGSILAVVAFAFVITGCATIFTGTQQDILVTSSPASAKVSIKANNGMEVFNGTTPATVKLPKKREYAVTISMDGYQSVTLPISQSFQALYLGNIICGGLIGLVIDAVNGAMWTLEPSMVSVSLTTAMNDMGERRLFAEFRTMDRDNNLRQFRVPLVRDAGR